MKTYHNYDLILHEKVGLFSPLYCIRIQDEKMFGIPNPQHCYLYH
jgi:hypothetical protein